MLDSANSYAELCMCVWDIYIFVIHLVIVLMKLFDGKFVNVDVASIFFIIQFTGILEFYT